MGVAQTGKRNYFSPHVVTKLILVSLYVHHEMTSLSQGSHAYNFFVGSTIYEKSFCQNSLYRSDSQRHRRTGIAFSVPASFGMDSTLSEVCKVDASQWNLTPEDGN
eukprot:gb/GECG01005389.1/.p1 GENE.gb/GECG01005389.1/~~gb/GECG01005389.1/.p1  ORF type:complete len:106 (+),score=10.49 gb/GECG01005389.1/:1-318(+)